MAKIERFKIYEDMYDATLTQDNLTLTTHTKTKAVFEDSNGDSYVISGEGFRYKGGMLQAGNIESVTTLDNELGTVSRLSNSNVDASKLPDDDVVTFLEGYAIQFLKHDVKIVGTKLTDVIIGRQGDDQIFGHGGDDLLFGGKGKDMISGDAGSDIFTYKKHDGKDTITDFSPGGGDGVRDEIHVFGWSDCEIVRDGKNTILEFSNSDTLTLLNIKPGQLHDDSIQFDV